MGFIKTLVKRISGSKPTSDTDTPSDSAKPVQKMGRLDAFAKFPPIKPGDKMTARVVNRDA